MNFLINLFKRLFSVSISESIKGTWKTEMSLMSLEIKTITIYGIDNKMASLLVINRFPNIANAKLVLLIIGIAKIENGYMYGETTNYEVLDNVNIPDNFVSQFIQQSTQNNKQKIVELSSEKMVVEGSVSKILMEANKISNDCDTNNIKKYLNLI